MLATWFGAGLLPTAPGTWGSLAALPLAWVVHSLWGKTGLAVGAGILFASGWWAAAAIAKVSVIKDPGAIVIDEVAAQCLVLLLAPAGMLAWTLAFLLFRIFDVWKPWPVRWADRHVPGGLGIMLDDLLAAIYVVPVLWGLAVIGGVFGV